MSLARERQVDAPVHHPLAAESFADADRGHQVDGSLFEHARADALDHVVLAPVFENDGVDARTMEQMPEHQPGRPGSDDADLGAKRTHWGEIS